MNELFDVAAAPQPRNRNLDSGPMCLQNLDISTADEEIVSELSSVVGVRIVLRDVKRNNAKKKFPTALQQVQPWHFLVRVLKYSVVVACEKYKEKKGRK